jgi:hypothetical protein
MFVGRDGHLSARTACIDHFVIGGELPMKSQMMIASGILVAALGSTIATVPAHALSMKECSAKYQAAKDAGTLKGATWNEFRKAECGAEAAETPATTPTTTPPTSTPASTPPPVASGPVKFPSAVNPKYSSESAGKARKETCLDQYKANKETGGNGGLKWIEKGGGYYSQCNKRLKGA